MPQTILIVEDEKDLSEVLAKKIIQQGYLVEIAKDGHEGLEKMREAKPDLVLLDIMMPKKNGIEVLEAMSKDSGLRDIPVIIISNSGQPVEISKALSLGVKDYLIKTEFDPEEVLEKIEKVFKGETPTAQKTDDGQSIDERPAPLTISLNENVGTAGKIMVVEDDKFLKELLEKKLKSEQYQVIQAGDGEEALKKVEEDVPDLILLDLILPGIHGFEVLEKIKSSLVPEIKKIPVIVLSNLGQKDDVEKGMLLGAEDFLVKAHHTPGEIVDKVREILANKKKR